MSDNKIDVQDDGERKPPKGFLVIVIVVLLIIFLFRVLGALISWP